MNEQDLNEFVEKMGRPGPLEEAFFKRRRALGLGVGLDGNGKIVRQKGPVFIDFKVSSLSSNSWPFEVGISWLDGQRVIVERKLIRPRPEWVEDDWHLISEAVHGISRAELNSAESADDVSDWLLKTVAGRALVSDAPELDQLWLDRLLGKTGPQVEDFDRMLWIASSDRNGTDTPGRWNETYNSRLGRKVLHRAGDDAAGLCYAWRAGVGQ